MRGIVILAVLLGVLVTGGYTFLHYQMMRDQGRLIPVGFGTAGEDTIEMHLAISDMMTVRDPPQAASRGRVLWKEWVEGHFVLRDDSGNRVAMRRLGTSALMMDSNAAGAPKFCLAATLKQGANYTLDYIPKSVGSNRYRYAFTAPSEPQEVWRARFKLVEDEQG